jgi:chitinase
MAFDYDRPHEGMVRMGAAAVAALSALHIQLARLHPRLNAAGIWAMEGLTLLPGIDSDPARTEITRLPDAARAVQHAEAEHIGLMSIWSAQRDNGNCPGVADSGRCSGITQRPWAFTRLLSRFTGGQH